MDSDVLAWLKSQGKGYQTRINAILREAKALDRLLVEAIRQRQAADARLAIADRVAAAAIEPMSLEEINAEVKAARAERHQRARHS